METENKTERENKRTLHVWRILKTRHATAWWKKKEDNFQRHNASAERGSRNATGHDTHNGTLENVEVYYALRCIVSM